MIRNGSTKSSASKTTKDLTSVRFRVGGSNLNPFTVVVNRSCFSGKIAKDSAMTRGRPRFVKRAFNLNPLNSQTWAFKRISPDFVNRLGACKTIGKNSYRCARFELFSEFQNGGFIRGCIKITNKIIFPSHPHHTRINAIHNRFTLALKPRCGDTKFILTSVRWIKRSQTNRLPR